MRDASGEVRDAAAALAEAGIEPVTLAEKEGLALINGTDGMLGMLVLAIVDLRALLGTADVAAAMSVEGLLGTDAVFAADLHELRPQVGQAASAANVRALLAGSEIVASHRGVEDTRVQDAYSLRCAPAVAGGARDTVDHAALVAERELAAAVDNPVITPDGRVESNGNFHGAPLAYVLDFLAIVAADVASISERRSDRFLDAARSHGLPPFLADQPGVDSGYTIAQYTQAALVSSPGSGSRCRPRVDSIPSSAMQEDHVSMGWSAARKLRRALDALARVLAIELPTAARGSAAARARCSRPPATAAVVAELEARVALTELPRPLPRAGRSRPSSSSSAADRIRAAAGARQRSAALEVSFPPSLPRSSSPTAALQRLRGEGGIAEVAADHRAVAQHHVLPRGLVGPLVAGGGEGVADGAGEPVVTGDHGAAGSGRRDPSNSAAAQMKAQPWKPGRPSWLAMSGADGLQQAVRRVGRDELGELRLDRVVRPPAGRRAPDPACSLKWR